MDFQKFMEENRKKLYKLADENTYKNDQGKIVLPKDDEWIFEDTLIDGQEYRN